MKTSPRSGRRSRLNIAAIGSMSLSEHAEPPLQMALRHMTDGQARIVFQEQFIAKLEQEGHLHMLPRARDLLLQLRKTQAAVKAHLARELAKCPSGIIERSSEIL